METDYKEIFPKRLKELRQKRGKTQDDLAESLGMWRTSVSMYESGRNYPLTETFIQVADYFNTTIDYLLGRTHDPSPFHLGGSPNAIDINRLEDLPLKFDGELLSVNDKVQIVTIITGILKMRKVNP